MLLASLRGSLTETLPDQPFTRVRPPA